MPTPMSRDRSPHGLYSILDSLRTRAAPAMISSFVRLLPDDSRGGFLTRRKKQEGPTPMDEMDPSQSAQTAARDLLKLPAKDLPKLEARLR